MPPSSLPNTIIRHLAYVAGQAEMHCYAALSLFRGAATEPPANLILLGGEAELLASRTATYYVMHGLDSFGTIAGPVWSVQPSIVQGVILRNW